MDIFIIDINIYGRRIFNAQMTRTLYCGKKLLSQYCDNFTYARLSLTRMKLRGGPLLKNIDRTDSLDFHCRRHSETYRKRWKQAFNFSAVFYARPNIHIPPCSLESETCRPI